MPEKLRRSASALTMELSTDSKSYLDILNRKPPRTVQSKKAPQFTQMLQKQQRLWGQVTTIHLKSGNGQDAVCIATVALFMN